MFFVIIVASMSIVCFVSTTELDPCKTDDNGNTAAKCHKTRSEVGCPMSRDYMEQRIGNVYCCCQCAGSSRTSINDPFSLHCNMESVTTAAPKILSTTELETTQSPTAAMTTPTTEFSSSTPDSSTNSTQENMFLTTIQTNEGLDQSQKNEPSFPHGTPETTISTPADSSLSTIAIYAAIAVVVVVIAIVVAVPRCRERKIPCNTSGANAAANASAASEANAAIEDSAGGDQSTNLLHRDSIDVDESTDLLQPSQACNGTNHNSEAEESAV